MNKKIAAISVNKQIQAIAALDLESIKQKLMDTDDGQGWSRGKADACEVEYKRFLMIAATYPQAPIVPSVDVDHFWHAHILDTRKYAQDCANTLGYFLHHAPHSGPKEAEDMARLQGAFAETRELYESLFGPGDEIHAAWCGRASDEAGKHAAWCGRASDEAGKQAAWCGRASDEAGKRAAWCGRASDEAGKHAAWCGRASDEAGMRAAWCGRASDEAGKRAAWCGRASDEAGKHAAWCGRASDEAGKRAAWCGRANDETGKRAAWCGRASDEAGKQAAWCGRASDEAGKQAAWCGRASDEAGKRAAWCGRASDEQVAEMPAQSKLAMEVSNALAHIAASEGAAALH